MGDKTQKWKEAQLRQAAKTIADIQLNGEVQRLRIDFLKETATQGLVEQAELRCAEESLRDAERKSLLNKLSEAAQRGDLVEMAAIQAQLSEMAQ